MTFLRYLQSIKKQKIAIVLLIAATIFAGSFTYDVRQASAALLTTSSIQLSNSVPSQTNTIYTATFTFPDTTSIKCVDIIYADTAADIGYPSTTAPSGMTTTSATKGGITGVLSSGNFTIYDGVNGIVQLEDATGHSPTSAGTVTIPINNITNSSSGTFYAQINTYSSLTTHTCSSLVDSSNVMALATTAGVAASVTVSPSLTFSVANYGSAVNGSGDTGPVATTSTTLPFGTVAAGSTAWGSQTLTTSTNAAHGYSVYVNYTGQMADANNDKFTDQTGTPSSPASYSGSSSTSSLGYTADGPGVTFGSNQWAGLATPSAQIATRTTPQSSDAFHIEYKIEPSNTQAPGTYTTTIVYTATPSY